MTKTQAMLRKIAALGGLRNDQWKGTLARKVSACCSRILIVIRSRFAVWTAWHGYFLVMGGFHLIEPPTENLTERASGTLPAENKSLDDDGPTILTLELLRRLVDDPEFELHISQDEIKDKSKGNALSKFIFILQTSWFIAQCIGRHVQGLELSQLELTTLALASLNGITILLWWKKPLGAQTPVRVYLRKRLDLQREGSIFHGCGTDLSLTSGSRSRLILLILGAPFYSILWCVNNFGLFRLIVGVILLPLSIGILLPLSVIFVFALTIFWAVTDLLVPAEFPVDNHATHVPTFYTPKHEYSEYWPFFLLALLGVVFGGIHCAGWNFPFPTYTYQLLWRISSLTISLIPICGPAVILIILIFRNLVKTFVGSATFELPRLYEIVTTSQVLTAFFGFLYAVVRLVLLGLALALLRNQPLSVFIALDWTKYYPHL